MGSAAHSLEVGLNFFVPKEARLDGSLSTRPSLGPCWGLGQRENGLHKRIHIASAVHKPRVGCGHQIGLAIAHHKRKGAVHELKQLVGVCGVVMDISDQGDNPTLATLRYAPKEVMG